MEFRLAVKQDLPEVMTIVKDAIALLKEQGSPQWQNGYGPQEEVLLKDIEKQELFVLVDERIVAMGVLVHGVDPVYTAIQNGEWQEVGPYVSIHRVAVASKVSRQGYAKKLLIALVDEAARQGISDIRIDTHQLNQGMQKAILAAGFIYRGEVVFPIPDGERLAYQLNI